MIKPNNIFFDNSINSLYSLLLLLQLSFFLAILYSIVLVVLVLTTVTETTTFERVINRHEIKIDNNTRPSVPQKTITTVATNTTNVQKNLI